jgi:hypothetical protein
MLADITRRDFLPELVATGSSEKESLQEKTASTISQRAALGESCHAEREENLARRAKVEM